MTSKRKSHGILQDHSRTEEHIRLLSRRLRIQGLILHSARPVVPVDGPLSGDVQRLLGGYMVGLYASLRSFAVFFVVFVRASEGGSKS